MTQNTTAVLMIDVQNMYISEDGMRDALGWPPIWRLHEVVAECAALLSEARAQGIPIIYSRAMPSAAGAVGANPRFERLAAALGDAIPALTPEQTSFSQQIMDAVAPQPGDLVLDKSRPSFFEYTELEPVLHNLGITRLLVAGLQTNVCVEATVRSGLAHNFEMAVAEDAVSTDGPALHWGALNSMRVLYTEVAPWRELLAPSAAWDTAFTTPNYGRDPEYWDARQSVS